MTLFTLHPTEEIRLRVAFVTAFERQRAAWRELQRQRCAARKPAQPYPVLFSDLEPLPPPRRRKKRAKPAPVSTAPASIFALGAAEAPRIRLRPASCAPEPAPLLRVVRDGDRVVCHRLRPQDTEEWQEREAARRARQVVPRPPKKARTVGKRLRELVGVDE